MPNIELNFTIIILAFFCELVDSTLGMGYGTTLTPLLLILGFEPIQVVPAILMSECVTGILAGVMHHELGNVNFNRDSKDFKVMLLMSALSVVGVIIAVFVAISLPAIAVKIYIGVLVLAIGIIILINHRREFAFSWRRIAGIGFLASFNKGISGGGYGPLVTGGQILSGINSKSAVGIASLAEGITSAVGIVFYLLNGAPIPWELAPSLVIGAVISVPLSAVAVRWMPTKRLTVLIGVTSIILGAYTLIKVFM